jgi:hypothetical protein
MTEMEFEREIAKLATLPRTDLVERWVALYHTPPPKGLGRRLLVGAIGYEMQAKRYGGLKPATDRRLRKLGDAPTNHEQGNSGMPSSLQPGHGWCANGTVIPIWSKWPMRGSSGKVTDTAHYRPSRVPSWS